MALINIVNNSGQSRTFYGHDIKYVTLEKGPNLGIDSDLWSEIMGLYSEELKQLIDDKALIVSSVDEAAPAPAPAPAPKPETPPASTPQTVKKAQTETKE